MLRRLGIRECAKLSPVREKFESGRVSNVLAIQIPC